MLIDRGNKVEYSIIDGWWKDTGNPGDLLEANMKLLDKYSEVNNYGETVNSSILGRVFIGKNSRIEDSKIIGPAFIGENAKIVDSVIGAYSSIGNSVKVTRSNISYSLVIEESVLNNVDISFSIIGKKTLLEKTEDNFKSSNYIIGENTRITVR